MAQSDPSTRLSEAIALANAGKSDEARTLLLELTQQYPDLEIAWMWLAAVTEDSEERITLLRRVLSINPANEKARSALTRLTGSAPEVPTSAAPIRSTPNPKSNSDTLLVVILTMVLVTVVVGIGAVLLNQRNARTVPLTPSSTPTATVTATLRFTLTPSNTPGGPTETPIAPKTLPPTWTLEPSPTAMPTFTPLPTNTDVPPATPFSTVTPMATRTMLPTLAPLPTSTPHGDTF